MYRRTLDFFFVQLFLCLGPDIDALPSEIETKMLHRFTSTYEELQQKPSLSTLTEPSSSPPCVRIKMHLRECPPQKKHQEGSLRSYCNGNISPF